MQSLGAVIMAGGRASRMGGPDKALLKLNGETFLKGIAGQLANMGEAWLSVDEPGRYAPDDIPQGFKMAPDKWSGCGPLGGLASTLKACACRWLLAVSCDLPLFNKGLADYLAQFISNDLDAVIAVDRSGRMHPLCGFYAKSALDVFERQLADKNYRMLDAFTSLRVKQVSLAHSIYPDEILTNINTPDDYRALRRLSPPVLAVSGVKNSGKTTVLAGLIPQLRAQGLRLAVIKHDGHDFDFDVPGTDSYRLREAGADIVAVYSGRRYLFTETRPVTGPEVLIDLIKDVDLILLEGGKHSLHPKIEVVRAAVSAQPVGRPETLLAVATDSGYNRPGLITFGLDDYPAMAGLILDWLDRGFTKI